MVNKLWQLVVALSVELIAAGYKVYITAANKVVADMVIRADFLDNKQQEVDG